MEIIDTAGQDEYTILNSKHFIGIHGYMIVYSVASKQSFEMVRIIRDKILNHLVSSYYLPPGRGRRVVSTHDWEGASVLTTTGSLRAPKRSPL